MRCLKFLLAALALGASATASFAQDGALEVIALRHRTAEQVLPALRPLLEPGGVLTAHRNQLIVRTSAQNLATLRAALAAIDTPARRLVIRVRSGGLQADSRQAIDAAARARLGERPGARLDVRGAESRSGLDERADRTIHVTEGAHAFIATGTSRALEERQVVRTPGGVVTTQTTAVQDLASGFEVVPHVTSEGVVLEIAERREAPGALPGEARVQRVTTTIRARFGEWVEIGATRTGAARDDRGLLGGAQSRASEERRVWVRVEEARP